MWNPRVSRSQQSDLGEISLFRHHWLHERLSTFFMSMFYSSGVGSFCFMVKIITKIAQKDSSLLLK